MQSYTHFCSLGCTQGSDSKYEPDQTAHLHQIPVKECHWSALYQVHEWTKEFGRNVCVIVSSNSLIYTNCPFKVTRLCCLDCLAPMNIKCMICKELAHFFNGLTHFCCNVHTKYAEVTLKSVNRKDTCILDRTLCNLVSQLRKLFLNLISEWLKIEWSCQNQCGLMHKCWIHTTELCWEYCLSGCPELTTLSEYQVFWSPVRRVHVYMHILVHFEHFM